MRESTRERQRGKMSKNEVGAKNVERIVLSTSTAAGTAAAAAAAAFCL